VEVIAGTRSLTRALNRPVVTIGNFDGIHLGHRRMIETVVGRARSLGGEAVVYTFDPHPRKVLYPERAPKLLATLDQKLDVLASLGVDDTILEPFDAALARVTPDAFVRHYLHERVRPIEVYVGYDFHYGRDREGSMRLLTETGPRLGFSVTVIPEVSVDGIEVSSSRIRDQLAAGDVEMSARMLGRPFAVRGRVVEGQKRGRTLGFPTANLAVHNEILPAPGVYAGCIRRIDAGAPTETPTLWPAVTNVGLRPTFEDGKGLVAEAHLIGFNGDLYGAEVELDFRHRLRAEQRFAGVEALKAQIALDVEQAKRRLAQAP
jgi:riboflavin kinase/FMN adenylyltransferase